MYQLIAFVFLVGPGLQDPARASAQRPPGVTFTAETPAAEMLHIDGSKNPELVPQWSAWGFVFRVIANGPGTLPQPVHAVASAEETAIVIREARRALDLEQRCQSRILELHARLGKESNRSLDGTLRRITLECRQGTLDVRDRVLAAINPDASTALRLFAESTKAGTSLSIRKKDLARFLEPE